MTADHEIRTLCNLVSDKLNMSGSNILRVSLAVTISELENYLHKAGGKRMR